jgi:hypothetical protein
MADPGATNGGWDVEALVREVLARLADGRQAEPVKANPAECVLQERVITLSSIDGQCEGIRTLVVPQRAVVTPAASDWLREKKIALRRSGEKPATGTAAKTPAARTLMLGVAETHFEPATLVERLGREGYKIEQLARTGTGGVIAELADAAVKGGNPALLLTEACELALCLANRRRGVRAALGTDRPSVRRAAEQIGANVLIVNPTMTMGFQLQQVIREFVEHCGKGSPAKWAALLD